MLPSPVASPSVARGRPQFAVHLDVRRAHLELRGELGRHTTHLLHDAVSALLLTAGPDWRLDVSGLIRCDQAGLRALGSTYRRGLRHGRRVTLLGTPPWLREALIRLRLDHHLIVPVVPPESGVRPPIAASR